MLFFSYRLEDYYCKFLQSLKTHSCGLQHFGQTRVVVHAGVESVDAGFEELHAGSEGGDAALEGG